MLDVKRNLTTMTDFYELTMSAGYLDEGYVDKIAVFDMFFRRVPDGGGYAVMAGLQQFIDAVDHLEFTDEDIDYLRSTKAFDEKFLTYLANFKLHCNIWAIEEGMPIFPQEPIVTVEGPAIECQLLETLLLVTFNHQCLIATKANRIVRSAANGTMPRFFTSSCRLSFSYCMIFTCCISRYCRSSIARMPSRSCPAVSISRRSISARARCPATTASTISNTVHSMERVATA